MDEELQVKSFESPDETVTFDNGHSERVDVGDRAFWLTTVEPAWRFSTDNAPDLDTDSCPSAHYLHVLSGRLTVQMETGARETLIAGDVAWIAPGHDAWVEGDEPAVFFEEDLESP